MNKPITALLVVLLTSLSTPTGSIQTAQAAALTQEPQTVSTISIEPVAPTLTGVVTGEARATTVVAKPISVRDQITALARAEFGSEAAVDATLFIIKHESNFNPKAVNPSSGACGLHQRLPCRGTDTLSVADQYKDFAQYVVERYGGPVEARAFWEINKWY